MGIVCHLKGRDTRTTAALIVCKMCGWMLYCTDVEAVNLLRTTMDCRVHIRRRPLNLDD